MSGAVQIMTPQERERDGAFSMLGTTQETAKYVRMIAGLPGTSPAWDEIAGHFDAICDSLKKIVRPS